MKYNNQTKCYKIDITINGKYATSTEQSKTCKEAIKKYEEKFGKANGIKANFVK